MQSNQLTICPCGSGCECGPICTCPTRTAPHVHPIALGSSISAGGKSFPAGPESVWIRRPASNIQSESR